MLWLKLRGRNYVIPEDVQNVYTDVCAHRLVLRPQAQADGKDARMILQEIMDDIRPKAERLTAMWKNRLAYGCLAGILAILLFFSGKSFLLVALLLSLLLIPVFGILIRRDGKCIKISLEKEKPVAAAIYSKGALRVADRVQIELEVKNEMFDRSECLQFLLPLKG